MEDDSISVLREQSRQLDKDVREVESRIRGNRAPQNKGFKRDSQRPAWQAHDDAASKRQRADTAVRPKLMSTIAVVVSPSHGSDRWNPNDEDSVQAAKPAAREVEQRPDNMSRNKRMLGALMGHLNTARKNLENDSTIKVQESIEINVALKNREQIKVAKREEGEKVPIY